MNRLDVVLGPENWWDEYLPGEKSVLCKLTLKMPDGTTVTKADAGGYAGMADQGDDDKSGFSDAFKRAAAKFGVARYLYRDGVPQYGKETSEVVVEAAKAISQPEAAPMLETARRRNSGRPMWICGRSCFRAIASRRKRLNTWRGVSWWTWITSASAV